jgi:hypothetical protein
VGWLVWVSRLNRSPRPVITPNLDHAEQGKILLQRVSAPHHSTISLVTFSPLFLFSNFFSTTSAWIYSLIKCLGLFSTEGLAVDKTNWMRQLHRRYGGHQVRFLFLWQFRGQGSIMRETSYLITCYCRHPTFLMLHETKIGL